MALRRPLVLADNYQEEMPTGDTLTPMGDIDMTSNKVINLAAGTVSGDALSYGQSGALLSGLNLGGQKATNAADPTVASDLATKNYVDNLVYGIHWLQPVRALATTDIVLSGLQTIDGVSLIAGQRVLLTGQTNPIENGIYVVAAGAWSRSVDMATGYAAAGAAVMVTEGTAYEETGWVCASNTGADIVDTDSLSFVQFTGTGSITAGAGLSKTGNQLDVELDTAANAQGAGIGGGSSGLEFNAAGTTGQLRAAVHATGGLERTATGLAARLNGTTLQSAAGGLSVRGLPSLFEINNIATGATVTAANLDTLTNGGDATTLHTHASAPKVQNVFVSNEAINANDPVVWSPTANQLNQGRANTDARAYCMGVSLTSAGASGINLTVVSDGVAPGVLTGATPGTPYYLQATGGMAATSPGAGNRVIQMGIAKNTTDLWVRIVDLGKKAV